MRPPCPFSMIFLEMERPRPVPTPTPLVVKPGIEDAFQTLHGNAGTGIANGEFPMRQAPLQVDEDITLAVHGLVGVGQHIHQNLAELAGITADLGALSQIGVDGDGGLELVGQENQGAVDQVGEIGRVLLLPVIAAKDAQRADDLGDAGEASRPRSILVRR